MKGKGFTGRLALATATAGAVAIGFAVPASAVTWWSSSNPLTVYEGSVAQGQGYGDFYNYNWTYARNDSSHRDLRVGGDGIYVQTRFQYFLELFGIGSYVWDDLRSTVRNTSYTWKASYVQDQLRTGRRSVRGNTSVCEDQAFQGDPCSATAVPTFNYG